jgi:hypothetical protein
MATAMAVVATVMVAVAAMATVVGGDGGNRRVRQWAGWATVVQCIFFSPIFSTFHHQ